MGEERSWSDLPADVLSLIRPHVYNNLQSLALFTFIDDDKCRLYHPFPVFEDVDTYFDFGDMELEHHRIAASNYGWLLLNVGCCLCLLNPFTCECDDNIPTLKEDDKFDIFQFSPSLDSSAYTIVAMKHLNWDGTDIAFLNAGDEEWTVTKFQNFGMFRTSFCNPVFIDGCYYFMGDEWNLGIFDIKAKDWKVCDKRLVPHRKRCRYRPLAMVEDDINGGGLFVVYETREHEQIFVARFDLSKMTWENVDCLGDDNALYISQGASYLETVIHKGMGNKIYLPAFHGEKGIYYSLDTKKFHSWDGSYCSQGPYELIQPRFCTWIRYRQTVECSSDDDCSSDGSASSATDGS